MKVVFKSQCTLRRSLTRVKSATPELKKKDVVYDVPCLDCDSKYIGETGRNLQKRLMEHKAVQSGREIGRMGLQCTSRTTTTV